MSDAAFRAKRQVFNLKTDGPAILRHSVWCEDDAPRVRKCSLVGDGAGLKVEVAVASHVRQMGLPVVATTVVGSCEADLELIMAPAPGLPLSQLSEAARLTAYESLALALRRLHQVPAEGAGYLVAAPTLIGAYDTWPDYLRSYLSAHLNYAWSWGLLTFGVCGRISHLVEAFCDLDSTRLQSSYLLHGDLSDANVFATTDGKVTALLDWEDALAGDPLFDLASWACFRAHHGQWQSFVRAYYGGEGPADLWERFWTYYLRIALCRLVLLHRKGVEDLTFAKSRVESALVHLS